MTQNPKYIMKCANLSKCGNSFGISSPSVLQKVRNNITPIVISDNGYLRSLYLIFCEILFMIFVLSDVCCYI